MRFQLDVDFAEGDTGKHLKMGSYVNKYLQIRLVGSSGYYNPALIFKLLLKTSSSVSFFITIFNHYLNCHISIFHLILSQDSAYNSVRTVRI